MLKRIHIGLAFAVVPLLLAGCLETAQPPTEPDAGSFHARLLEIAGTYESFGRTDPELLRWAPVYCRAPDPNARPVMSASGDSQTHGRKLYSLFVSKWPKDPNLFDGYVSETVSPVGQVLVKESWVPDAVKDEPAKREPVVKKVKGTRTTADGKQETFEIEDRFLPYVEKDGQWYRAAERGPLFVMMKLDPGTPGTDEGWVYGVVSADGKEVMEAGRITSCMNCHVKAKHDRLFGPPKE